MSLAIFAPNAKGKSSLVDAIEYYFSPDATLERLGQRAGQSQAGPGALEHIKAGVSGVTPQVGFKFRHGVTNLGDTRRIPDGREVPDAAKLVLSAIKVPFVTHGYELRGFVEATAEQRYREIASWFSLDSLLALQRNLRTLQRQVKAKADSQTEVTERLHDLRRATSNGVSTWDAVKVCDWFNGHVLSKLDPSLVLGEISEADNIFPVLTQRMREEEKRIGVATLKALIKQIDALTTSINDSAEETPGLIGSFERSGSDYALAIENEASERYRASQSIFNDVWSKAELLFDKEDHDFNACPICDTEFGSTPHRSRDAVRISLTDKLAMLTSYRRAEKTLRSAKQQLSQDSQALITALEGLCTGLVDADRESDSESALAYLEELRTWHHNLPLPNSESLEREVLSARQSLNDARQQLEEQQGENTYANAHKIVTQLIQVRKDLIRICRTKEELRKLLGELVNQASTIEATINRRIEGLLSQLESDVDALYKKIQGVSLNGPSLLRLQLAEGSAANQQQVRLVVDYAENRKGVAPSGYLSDSQIHTVALSLRLAAIRSFNSGAPIIVLDDVVTSYDADHRKSMAAALAEEFEDFQIVLVTHDEQFFELLQDHLPEAKWAFRRITHIDPCFGPVFSDHRTPDEEIERKLDVGEPAGEEIRKSQEEWLLRTCRDFGVEVVIRPIDRPYQYDRNELATALHNFLKAKDLMPPEVSGISNPFLISLQRGVVENFASHFSDNPYRSTSGGDEKTRWNEFRYFRDSFVCPNCGRNRFKRPRDLAVPVCKTRKCEARFNFQPILSAEM